MKKFFYLIVSLLILSVIFIPTFSLAKECLNQEGIVRCGIDKTCPCDICDFFAMLTRIYDFIVKTIATPLAIIAMVVGGILMLISAGNPNLLGKGKKILYAAIIGLALVYCSWLIINFTLTAVGYKSEMGNWWELNISCT